MTSPTIIHWFRQDLRLADNPALITAARRGRVLPVYVLDDENAGRWKMGAASRWWLHHSLVALDRELGGRLQVWRGDPLTLLPGLARQFQAGTVTWNRCYEPWQRERDRLLQARLEQQQVQVKSFNSSLLWEPGDVLKADGQAYRVFTPYYVRGCRAASPPRIPAAPPGNLDLCECDQPRDKIATLGLLPSINWYGGLDKTWAPGLHGAAVRLKEFLSADLDNYRSGRDFPDQQTVSRLSPHLHFGELSSNQVWYQVQQFGQTHGLEDQVDALHRQLAWREFSNYLLFHFPDLPERNLQCRFDSFPWRDAKTDFRRWSQGSTGYPLVDAGMRELWQTGYMHNRVRMITASFLTKNLLIDWRRGADWFWDCLVDADLANNSASWQWVAGSGTDAAPYFRIFNPTTQGKKFDPDGGYIRRFVPELTDLPDRYLHDPSSAPDAVLSAAGIVLDRDYPRAMVELPFSRTRALSAYRSLPSGSGTPLRRAAQDGISPPAKAGAR